MNIDDPSLYLPCPFPPTYHPPTNLYADDPFTLEQDISWAASDGKSRCSIRSLHVLGPYDREWSFGSADVPTAQHDETFCVSASKSSPSLFIEFREDDKGLPRRRMEDASGKQRPSTSFALRPVQGSFNSTGLTARPFKFESSPSSNPHSRMNDLEQQSGTSPRQDSQSLDNARTPLPMNESAGCERTQQLESYILGKKRDHLLTLQYQAALWHQEKKEAEEQREAELVEAELQDSARGHSVVREQETSGYPSCPGDSAYGTGLQVNAKAFPPLELEASALLQLLPPLERYSADGCTVESQGGAGHNFRLKPTPTTYPYLKASATELGTSEATLSPSRPNANQRDQIFSSIRTLTDTSFSNQCQPLQPKRLIAFHTAGHGLGWMDFEACDDWIVVQKRRRTD